MVLETLEDVLRQDRYLYLSELEKKRKEISGRCRRTFKDIEKAAGVEWGTITRKSLTSTLTWCFKKDRVKLLQACLESLKLIL